MGRGRGRHWKGIGTDFIGPLIAFQPVAALFEQKGLLCTLFRDFSGQAEGVFPVDSIRIVQTAENHASEHDGLGQKEAA